LNSFYIHSAQEGVTFASVFFVATTHYRTGAQLKAKALTRDEGGHGLAEEAVREHSSPKRGALSQLGALF